MSRPSTSKPRGVCYFYSTPTGCRAGDSCKFLHGEETITPYDKSKRCKFWEAGYCRRGDSCWFIHGPAPSDSNSTEAESSTSKTKLETEDDPCSICYEKPTTYGLLVGCSHIFCIKCIREWRGSRNREHDTMETQDVKKCPICRQTTRLILPSSHFYPEGSEQKANALVQYKDSMARIPCRHFQASLERRRPYCPFGKDCHYQHLNRNGTPHVFKYGIDDRPTRRRRPYSIPEQWFVDAIISIADEFAALNFGTGDIVAPDLWEADWLEDDRDDEDEEGGESSDDEQDFETALGYGATALNYDDAHEFVMSSMARITGLDNESDTGGRLHNFSVNPPILPHQIESSGPGLTLAEHAAFRATEDERATSPSPGVRELILLQPEQETIGRFRTSVTGRGSTSYGETAPVEPPMDWADWAPEEGARESTDNEWRPRPATGTYRSPEAPPGSTAGLSSNAEGPNTPTNPRSIETPPAVTSESNMDAWWTAHQHPNPPLKTDGRGRVVFVRSDHDERNAAVRTTKV